jgi:signal transduction histidine kinase
MKILSKPSGALVTQWRNNEFLAARLKLTALYVTVTAIILASFSGFLYYEVEDQIAEFAVGESQLQDDPTEDEEDVEPLVDEFISDFEENVVFANLIILLLVGLLGYWLAGRTLQPIEEKMRQHEQFSSDVSHEIRTPLSAMLARTESVLRKGETAEVYQHALQQFKDETIRLITLTEDLLLTTRQNGNKQMESVSLKSLVDGVIERFRLLAEHKQLTLTVTTKDETVINGNPLLLERLFENIIHNAIKFTPAGGVITVAVTGREVSISDTGVGMSRTTSAKAFDRFYTEDNARDERQQGGTGLGLAIAKQIAELHHAALAIDSREGEGTTVTVTFFN